MTEMSDVTKDKLIADVKLVIADSEELLRATAGQAGGQYETVCQVDVGLTKNGVAGVLLICEVCRSCSTNKCVGR